MGNTVKEPSPVVQELEHQPGNLNSVQELSSVNRNQNQEHHTGTQQQQPNSKQPNSKQPNSNQSNSNQSNSNQSNSNILNTTKLKTKITFKPTKFKTKELKTEESAKARQPYSN